MDIFPLFGSGDSKAGEAELGLSPRVEGGPAGTAVSIVVLVTERPESLAELYKEYRTPIRAMGQPFEFLFVVPPHFRALTAPLAELIGRGEPIRVLEVGDQVGEAAMLRLAVTGTSSPILVTMPAYARVKASAIPELIAAVEQGADLALARRWPRRDSWINRVQNRALHLAIRRLVGVNLNDIASGVRAIRRDLLLEIPLYGEFSRFLPLLALREGYRVVEIPSPQHTHDAQTRVYHPGIYLRRLVDLIGLMFLLRFTDKPLRFFGLIGSLLASTGTVLLVILLLQRLEGEGIAARPFLLLSVLLLTLGVQAIALGLVGEMIVHLNASRRRGYRLAAKPAAVTRPEGRAAPSGFRERRAKPGDRTSLPFGERRRPVPTG